METVPFLYFALGSLERSYKENCMRKAAIKLLPLEELEMTGKSLDLQAWRAGEQSLRQCGCSGGVRQDSGQTLYSGRRGR